MNAGALLKATSKALLLMSPIVLGHQFATAGEAPDFAGGLRTAIDEKMAGWVTPGIVVYVDVPGRGTWVEGFGMADLATGAPSDPLNHHRVGSVTKTLTGVSILLLVDEHKIGLDDSVEKYLPGMVPNGANITIRQLMDMTSGIYNFTEDENYNITIDAEPDKVWSAEESIAIAVKHPPYHAPGAAFHYSNTNTELLGLIVEKLSGIALSAFVESRILTPLGMTHTSIPAAADASLPAPYEHGYFFGTNLDGMKAYNLVVAGGDPKTAVVPWPEGRPPVDATNFSVSSSPASGSAISTLADMAIWAKALATGSLLTPATHRQQITWSPHAHYGLNITEVLPGMLGHNGAIPGYQTLVAYDPESGGTIVVFANNQLEPNMPFFDGLPADEVGKLIQKELFPVAN